MSDSSAQLRGRVLELRGRNSPQDAKRKSLEICRKVVARWEEEAKRSPDLWRGLRVASYRGMPGEVQLDELNRFLAESGCELYFPRLSKPEGEQKLRNIEFARPPQAGEAWTRGVFGIEEPAAGAATLPIGELDLILVPGVAFGQRGERIGMGKGHYDRVLEGAPEALRVALAFDFQIFPRLEQMSWDQPVHWVFSESREIQLPGADQWMRRRAKRRHG